MKNIVSLVKCNNDLTDIASTMKQALDLIHFKTTHNIKSAIIKPNLCYYWDTTTGQTTDPRIVECLIDWIRANYGNEVAIRIAEADASAMRTTYAFKMLGYEQLAHKKDVTLYNLSQDDVLTKQIVINDKTLEFKVPTSVVESDLFINVPKLKIHTIGNIYITCALKNIFGCIATPRKVRYHKNLNEAIVGINCILQPHLTVVDGLIALGKIPIKLGLIMASASPFHVDWVASQIMGYNPNKIEFLKLALQNQLGNPQNVVIKGEDYKNIKKDFPKLNMRTMAFLKTLQLKMLKTYTKLAGDIKNPVLDD